MRRFRKAQSQNQASIVKHLKANNALLESSSEEEDEELLEKAVGKVLSNYQYEGGDTEKALTYLTEVFQSGGAICLICISSVKKTDAIWSCSKCFTFMHLPCTQHWIRDSLSYKNEKGIIPLWCCPKCRAEYPEDQIPGKYVCFCGKTEDPPYQPWSIPHSCGETCGKFLQPKCGHKCTLLCHPGPCPPCPKMVTVKCFCGKQPTRQRRCNDKEWSCEDVCNKQYKNCTHRCLQKCHSGDCTPCYEMVLSTCNCKHKSEMKKCNEASWHCDKPCARYFSCNIHVCEGVCHKPGDCSTCPFEGNRTCPCGKKKFSISCKQQNAPTCGDTCGKLLDCGAHYCSMRCHTERCGQCLEVVTKKCRCESYTKEIACTKEFHCNKKCLQLRLCGRHSCNKKCCDCLLKNTYNVCEKTCDNTLNCRKHKCSAPCHSGPCYPCTRTIVIQCRCGSSKITVPCGTLKKIKPPNCNKMCKVPPICHHPKRESHKCHQGECPPCRKICGLVRKRCGHSCPEICHSKVWVKNKNGVPEQPAGPWENRKEKWELKSLPCPSCVVSIMVTCLGGHETRSWPCHKAIPSSCQRECGQLLSCTNHTCVKLCHKIQPDDDDEDTKCMECEQPCLFDRPKGCTHACPKPCHPAPCDPCKQIVRVPCHCGITVLYKRCAQLTSATVDTRNELLQCGNQCPKNYLCGHRCVDDCHPGPCEKAEFCNKKVKILCKCKRIKKDSSCDIIRAGKGLVECDDLCLKKKEEAERTRQYELEKKIKEEELRNQKEIEIFEKKFQRRKKGKNKYQNKGNAKDNSNTHRWIWILAVIFAIIATAVILYLNITP